ncbi:putative DNA sulfur modification protein DndD [Mycobacterium parascrofulaceum ATCC BAA-614]|uniref:Nuclease SbcCD subunit C n=1 Tax=Mycobacterium parascrofulaceum ATCC BAA-614 TaxID=525368 RepID=D5P7D5_9MYCO|nr:MULTISPECIES: AAA family ATPase [Mycobacterium]EFG78010.1 putative DNA sulfur modification protein DndD [Mycobacterium parascrofulaceum ATCC BAA-614]
MKLHRIRLENFRQFQGISEIEFAQDKQQNVTLIWGANGAGKTTLLNAFTWVLYGQFTKDFEKPKSLGNQDTWASLNPGERLRVSVELEFENAEQIFTATRTSIFRKADDGSSIVEEEGRPSLQYIDQSGRSEVSGNPDDHIRQILPERLHSFFFFNGERIEHLVQASAYEEIEDAIKTILGLKVVERAISHLPKAARRFEQELKAHGTDEQRDITRKLEDLDGQLGQAQSQRSESEKRATQWQDEIDAVDSKLRGTEEAREQQKRRDILIKQESDQLGSIEKINERIHRLIRERGYLAFGLKLFTQTRKQFVDKREKKELPAPVKRDFIEDLLEEGTCICGASLAEGTEGHRHIMTWKERAGLAEVEQRWGELYAYADSYTGQRLAMAGDLATLLDDRQSAVDQLRLLREQLSELSASLQGITRDNIDELESHRVAARRSKDDEIRQQGRLERSIENLRVRKQQLEADLKRAASVEAKAALAQRRLTVTREALNTLEKVYAIRTEQTRSDLDEKIKSIYQQISFKPYTPEVSPTFQLNLMHIATQEPVAKSTGENQILSLSFVGALASIARDRYEETKGAISAQTEVRGGIFPIVMDAAFGSLDLNYRREVALGLPGLAEQVVVIVSKSGGDGAYEHLKDRVGRSYVIQYLTPKSDTKPETISIEGREYPYVQPSDDGSEYALIAEVE